MSTENNIYKCDSPNCNREFGEKEYEVTQNSKKCILHCEKEIENNWYKNDISDYDKQIIENFGEIEYSFSGEVIGKRQSTIVKKWNQEYINKFWNIILDKEKKEFVSEQVCYVIFPEFYSEDLSIIKEAFEKSSNYFGIKFMSKVNFENFNFKKNISFHASEFYDEVEFPNTIFEKSVSFEQVTFNKITNFSNSTFNDRINFGYSTKFENSLSFGSCIFKGNAVFGNSVSSDGTLHLKDLHFNDCTFNDRVCFLKIKDIINLYFRNNTIKSEFIFQGITDYHIHGKFDFSNMIFNGICDFSRTEFKRVDFKNTVFNDKAIFTDTVFNQDVKFEYTSFNKNAIFRNATFKDNFDFKDTVIDDKSSFLDIQFEKTNNVANRETARIIKDSFEKQNNIIEANRFYALEMKEREKELKWYKEPFEWLVFKIHNVTSNHSQDWFLPLLWIIIISFVVGLFNQKYYFELDKFIFINITLLIPLFIGFKFVGLNRKIGLVVFILLFYSCPLVNLDFVSSLINPFSIMSGKENLTFGTLIFKIIIAYLIYQLIISIRQNTRRK